MTNELLKALETIKNMPPPETSKRSSRSARQYPYAYDKRTREAFYLLAVDDDMAWVKTISKYPTRSTVAVEHLHYMTAFEYAAFVNLNTEN